MPVRTETSPLTCQFDRLKDGRAVLRLTDNQEITIAQRLLPTGIRPGQTLEIHLFTPETAQQHRQELARAVLKEILNS